MINSRIIQNDRVVTLSPGWVLFIAWAHSQGMDSSILKNMIDRGGKPFLEYLSMITEIWNEEFIAYAELSNESAEELSSHLLSYISDTLN